jgi:hypothetical protein
MSMIERPQTDKYPEPHVEKYSGRTRTTIVSAAIVLLWAPIICLIVHYWRT